MASKLLCATPACGKSATHRAIRRGQTVGLVCSECRIGPNIDQTDTNEAMVRGERIRRLSSIQSVSKLLATTARMRWYIYRLMLRNPSAFTLAENHVLGNSGETAADYADKSMDMMIANMKTIRAGGDYNVGLIFYRRTTNLHQIVEIAIASGTSDSTTDPATGLLMPTNSRQADALDANQQDQGQRITDIQNMAESLGKLAWLRLAMDEMTPRELSAATLSIGSTISNADMIDMTIDMVITQLQRIRSGADYDADIVDKLMQQLRNHLDSDAKRDAFDSIMPDTLEDFRSMNTVTQLDSQRVSKALPL